MTSPATPTDPRQSAASPPLDELDAKIDDVLDRIGAFIGFWLRAALLVAVVWGCYWLLFLSPTSAAISDSVYLALDVAVLITLAVGLVALEILILVARAYPFRISWAMPKDTSTRLVDFKGNHAAVERATQMARLLEGIKSLKPVSGEIHRGMVIVGPHGAGKAYLARCLAGEVGAASAFVDALTLRSGPSWLAGLRIRRLYAKARTLARQHGVCIVYIDGLELSSGASVGCTAVDDAIAAELVPPPVNDAWPARLLRAMGFRPGPPALSPVFTVATAATLDGIAPTLRRSGRLERTLALELPDDEGRAALLRHYVELVPHDPEIAVERVARETAGFGATSLRFLVNEAMVLALADGRGSIDERDLNRALDLAR